MVMLILPVQRLILKARLLNARNIFKFKLYTSGFLCVNCTSLVEFGREAVDKWNVYQYMFLSFVPFVVVKLLR